MNLQQKKKKEETALEPERYRIEKGDSVPQVTGLETHYPDMPCHHFLVCILQP